MFARPKSHHNFRRRGIFVTKHINSVADGLALTPSQMLELSQHGVPVSSHFDDSQFYDGDSTNSLDLLPEHIRGLDISDYWNMSRDARAKFSKAARHDKAFFGTPTNDSNT